MIFAFVLRALLRRLVRRVLLTLLAALIVVAGLLGLLVGVTGGALDEFHQRFVPSRGPSLRDVLIDTMGAIFFQVAIAIWISWRQNRATR